MKRILIAVLGLCSTFGFAQLELKKLDGTPINDGDIFTYTVNTEPDAYLGLKIYNTSDEDLLIKAQVVDITNSNGTNLQFCVADVCLLSITEGSVFPNFPATIPANGENSNFDHFVNYNSGIDQTQPVEYILKIFMADDSGNPVGNSVTFTYRYVSSLSTDSFTLANIGVAVKSTMVSQMLEMTADSDVQLSIFDINGKKAIDQKVIAGQSSIDVSALSAGVYIASFNTAAGKSASTRIIKK